MTRDEKIKKAFENVKKMPQNEVNVILFAMLLGMINDRDRSAADEIIKRVI